MPDIFFDQVDDGRKGVVVGGKIEIERSTEEMVSAVGDKELAG